MGINPGLRSEQLGHHFAGRGNPFWHLLHAAGITPVLLDPSEDRHLADFGLALTNLCPRATRSAAELDRDELAAGRQGLLRKVARLEPAVVALVGVTLYRQVFPKPTGGPGAGAKPERLHGARLFVVPNPSGLNAAYPGFQHKLVWFQALRDFADDATRPASARGPARRRRATTARRSQPRAAATSTERGRSAPRSTE